MKLSIITINRDNSEGLRKTMESVFAQTYRDFEYIVVDGNSTDDSVDVIKEYEEQLHLTHSTIHFKWISEPDTGIYNAMNKGVKMSHGEYTLMLNSGDYLVDEHVIERIMPELDGTDIIQGNRLEIIDNNTWRNKGYGRSTISFLDVHGGCFLHQASFCRVELFQKYGYFREDYKYVSDTIFFVIVLGYNKATFKYVEMDIAYFDMNGVSNINDKNIRVQHRQEENRMYHEMFPGRLYDYCLDNRRKVEFYDTLNRHKWIWNIALLLSRLSNFFYGQQHTPKKEIIK